jgi:hypothetical protein
MFQREEPMPATLQVTCNRCGHATTLTIVKRYVEVVKTMSSAEVWVGSFWALMNEASDQLVVHQHSDPIERFTLSADCLMIVEAKMCAGTGSVTLAAGEPAIQRFVFDADVAVSKGRSV